jgi:hypothetical protein
MGKVMEWALEDTPKKKDEIAVSNFLFKRTKNEKVAKNVGRMLNLHSFIRSQKFKSAQELRNKIFSDSAHTKPLFSLKQADTLIKLQKQRGGGGVIIERLIGRVSQSIKEFTPDSVEGPLETIKPWIFILESLEKNEEIGPLISIALDTATHSLPVIASTVENITPELAGLIPIPESSTIGIAVGWFIAAQFTLLSLALNMSRGHFDEVFINSFLLIPLVGTSIHNAAMKGDDFITETAGKRNKLLNAVRKTVPLFGEAIADILETVIPDLLYDPDNPEHVAKAAENRQKIDDHITKLKEIADKHLDSLAEGGKRFSTRKRKHTKWRTQRKRFVRH